MSFLSQAYLLEKYGPRLSMQDLARVLGIAHGTLRNRLSAGTLKVRTYVDGGTRYADYRDVAAYLDECREATPA
jgi:DNA-directed RNA polymerase specialized sigma24 family protein